ncbi:MAG: iron ABC transporter permease [Natronospirillum sp.]
MRRSFPLPRPDTLLGIGISLFLLVLVAAPMVLVLAQAFMPGILKGDFHFVGLSNLQELFNRRLWRVSLMNSLYLSGNTALWGTLLGTLLAVIRHQTRIVGATALDLCAWALLIMPSFIIAQGWILFSIRNGIAAQWLGLPWIYDAVFTPQGLVAIMSFKNYPFAYLAVSAAMQWHVKEYQHAARLCGAGPWRALMTVRLPLLLPAILSGMVLVFIDTLGDFGLPAALATTYRFPTLPYTIFTAINQSPIRFDLAGVLSVYLMLILMVAVALYLWLLRRSRFDFLTAKAEAGHASNARPNPWLSALSIGFIVIALGIPLGTSLLVSMVDTVSVGLTFENLTLSHYLAVLQPNSVLRQALSNSLQIALIAAISSVVIAFLSAYLLTFSRFSLNGLIEVICTLTLAVPGVILGVGFIFFWNHPWLDAVGLSLYGHPFILVLAGMAGAIPIAIRVLLGAMGQIPHSFMAAAALQGVGLPRRLMTILLPLTLAAFLSAGLASFGSSVFDLAVTSILHPPGYAVLPVVIDRMFQQGYYGQSTASTLIAATITLTLIQLTQVSVRRLFKHLFQSTTQYGSDTLQPSMPMQTPTAAEVRHA